MYCMNNNSFVFVWTRTWTYRTSVLYGDKCVYNKRERKIDIFKWVNWKFASAVQKRENLGSRGIWVVRYWSYSGTLYTQVILFWLEDNLRHFGVDEVTSLEKLHVKRASMENHKNAESTVAEKSVHHELLLT